MKEIIKSILKTPTFWAIIIPALIAVITFALTERNKLKWEQYKRKEQSYATLIKSIRGFYVNSQDKELKSRFIEQLNLCWLYAPDEVIKKGYDFLSTIHTGQKSTDEVKESALGDFVATIRKDLLEQRIVTKTKLTGKDYRHLRAN